MVAGSHPYSWLVLTYLLAVLTGDNIPGWVLGMQPRSLGRVEIQLSASCLQGWRSTTELALGAHETISRRDRYQPK